MGDESRRRGRYIDPETRQMFIELVKEAQAGGCRKQIACEDLGISEKAVLRWEQAENLVDQRKNRTFEPANKLGEEEVDAIVKLLNSKEFCDQPPSQIVPTLLDRNEYYASESTMYRILRKHKMMAHRGRQHPSKKGSCPRSFAASKPKQVWTWDITYLPAKGRDKHYYLYMIMDIFSRKIVGWVVHDEEKAEHAADLVKQAFTSESAKKGLVLHSDNGSPMRGAKMQKMLRTLDIIPSFSRPAVSNDNPYSESLFRTLKSHPSFPDRRFSSQDVAKDWAARFVHWYNSEHRHRGLKFLTPNQRHTRQDGAIMLNRRNVLEQAKANHPERWSRNTRNWDLPEVVELNPPKGKTKNKDRAA